MRTYYCKCGGKVEVIENVVGECKCGKLFGVGNSKMSNGINMRKTLAHTTKIEFSESTVEKSMEKMKGSFK
jgi:alpha-D-ribose 1-methylphosphonate 5-phosphate C-P lyase|tara:strand:- start:246 stop:458 length:213 start_codon:yes stop_codon:yes gene_type:complete